MQTKINQEKKDDGLLMNIVNLIEVIGNKIPHPFLMFMFLWILVLVLSHFVAGASAIVPGTGEKVEAISLLNREGLTWLLTNLVDIYAQFPPLGLLCVLMIGIGIMEESGLFSEIMKRVARVPDKYLVFTVFLVGICGNLTGDAAIFILPPLTASLFFSQKKDPLLGLAIGYAATSGGFTANLFIAGYDVTLAGMTTAAARVIDPNITIYPTCNWYFMVAATIILAIVATFYTNKYLMPTLGKWDKKYEYCEAARELKQNESVHEYKDDTKVNEGLKAALWSTIIFWVIIVLLVAIPGAPLRDLEKDTIIPSPFIEGIVPILLIYFSLVGLVYGYKTGKFTKFADAVTGMENGLKSLAGLLVLILPTAMFVDTFSKSNMSAVLAIKLADFLDKIGLTGATLFIAMIIVVGFINIFIGSGSGKWALLSPIFVPMMYFLGYAPEFAQLVYRIGDTSTNTLSPLKAVVVYYIAFARKYDENAGIGTIISRVFPYAVLFTVVLTIMLLICFFFKIPFGPGSTIFVQ